VTLFASGIDVDHNPAKPCTSQGADLNVIW
jgi:hypothetical protein